MAAPPPGACGMVLACLLVLLPNVAAQQLSPLLGQGEPPIAEHHNHTDPMSNATHTHPFDIYVSVLLDRLIQVDDIQYRFEAVLFMYLSWRDPRAADAIANATAAAAASGTCGLPCTTMVRFTPGDLCCDSVYLPSFEFVNARGFSQDRVVRSTVRLPTPQDIASGVDPDSVAWSVRVQGEFFTPLQFQAFPFDKQYLTIQVEYVQRFPNQTVNIIPSSVGTHVYRPLTNDDLSGWQVEAVDVLNFTRAGKDLHTKMATPSLTTDPWPVNPGFMLRPDAGSDVVVSTVDGDSYTGATSAHMHAHEMVGSNSSDPNAFKDYTWYQGFHVVITVTRTSVYYVFIAILPIAINVWLCLLVFSVDPKHLDTRLGIVVTLFLSLTAIQYVVNASLPSSSTIVPTQQLILASYIVLGMIGLCSIITYYLSTTARRRQKQESIERARKSFKYNWHDTTNAPPSFIKPARKAAARKAGFLHFFSPSTWFGSADADAAAAAEAEAVAAAALAGSGAAANGDAHHLRFDPEQQGGPPAGYPPPLPHPHSEDADATAHFRGVGMAPAGSEASSEPGSPKSDDGGRGVPYLRQPQPSWGGEGPPPPLPLGALDAAPRFPGLGGAGRAGPEAERTRHWDEVRAVTKRSGGKPSWSHLQRLKFKAVWHEMNTSSEYALHVAEKLDRWLFWVSLVGYNAALVVIFAVGSTKSSDLILA